jgi:NifU-like protein involved in Fe-S cluster formation
MASASEIYHRAIQTLAQEAVGEGRLDHPGGTAFLDNPLCGDCVDMQVDVRESRIHAIGHKVRGCLLCRASASMIGKHALGATHEDIARVATAVGTFLREQGPAPDDWPDLDLFTPVRGHASRYSCVELPFKALLAALSK